MEITIIETGEKEELTIIDPKSGCNWINDMMGNCGALPDYNDDDGTYHIAKDDFEWWDNLTAAYQKADEDYHGLLNNLDGQDYDNLIADFENLSCDLEDYPNCLNQICDNHSK